MNYTSMKKTRTVVAIFLALTIFILCAMPTSALSKPLAEVTSNAVNQSTLSSDEIYQGESVTIYGKSSIINASKSYYAYYYKMTDAANWTQLSDYTKNNSYVFTPESDGSYSICVKIYSATKIVYKKYLTLTVRKALLNHSLVSSAYAEPNQSITLTGRASGGVSDYTYAFFNRKKGEEKWSTLSDFGTATEISMSPSETGEYELRITVRDKNGRTTDKEFPLSVSPLKVTSAQYDLTVQAPMSAPYQWTTTVTDHTLIEVSQPEVVDTDVLNAMSAMRYRITALGVGSTTLTMKYTAYSGKTYEMKYTITVDNKLNFSVTSSEGNYFVKKIPQPEVYATQFKIKVRDYQDTYGWKCVSNSPYVIQNADSYTDGEYKVYRFNNIRSGKATIHFSYIADQENDVKYELIYNISVDGHLTPTVESTYGYYVDEDFPELQIIK